MHIENLAKHIPDIQYILDTPRLAKRVEIEAQYSQISRLQQTHMEEIKKEATLKIPDELDLGTLPGLSNECREVLVQTRPVNVSAIVRQRGKGR